MFRREHKVSTVKSGLSMLSSMFFFTLDMNIQSRLLEQVAVGGSSSAALISKSAYFLRSNARLASRLAILAFSMFMLKGFTIYSSAPIWRPSRMFFSSPSAVSSSIYNPQIQISAESETKRSIFREKDKTKRSKKESAQHSKSRNKSFVMTSVSAL